MIRILVVLFLCYFSSISFLFAKDNKKPTIIIGEYTVKVKPDKAYVNVIISAKADSNEIISKIDYKISSLAERISGAELPKANIITNGITPIIEKRVIGFKKSYTSLSSDITITGNDYLKEKEQKDNTANTYKKEYIYDYTGTQEFTIAIEDISDAKKLEQLIHIISSFDNDITLKQTPAASYEPKVYSGVILYGFKEETLVNIKSETVSKAFNKAVEKLNEFTEKTSAISSGNISIYEDEICFGNRLSENGLISITANVKLIF